MGNIILPILNSSTSYYFCFKRWVTFKKGQFWTKKTKSFLTMNIDFAYHIIRLFFCRILTKWSHYVYQMFRWYWSCCIFVVNCEGLFHFYGERMVKYCKKNSLHPYFLDKKVSPSFLVDKKSSPLFFKKTLSPSFYIIQNQTTVIKTVFFEKRNLEFCKIRCWYRED